MRCSQLRYSDHSLKACNAGNLKEEYQYFRGICLLHQKVSHLRRSFIYWMKFKI